MAFDPLIEFSLAPSPVPDIVLSRYDPVSWPSFAVIFEPPSPDNPLQFLAQPAEEEDRSAVMENRGERDITALCYCWVRTTENGEALRHACSSDSYATSVYHPILKANDRKLITGSMTVDESLIVHVLHGGGCMSGSVGSTRRMDGVVSLRLEIDMLLFADGEIAGPDVDRHVAQLQFRKRAGDFIAKQVRLAQSEQRDVTPVLLRWPKCLVCEITAQRDGRPTTLANTPRPICGILQWGSKRPWFKVWRIVRHCRSSTAGRRVLRNRVGGTRYRNASASGTS